MRLPCLAAFALFSASVVARADTVNVSLSNSLQTAAAGSTVTFSGTISAPTTNTGDIFIYGDTVDLSSGATDDDSSFSNNVTFGDYEFAPGQSFTGDFFTVTVVDPSEAPYSGFLLVQGGSSADSQDTLSTTPFTVDLPTSVTPEPSSIALLSTGLLGFAGVLRKRLS